MNSTHTPLGQPQPAEAATEVGADLMTPADWLSSRIDMVLAALLVGLLAAAVLVQP